MHSTIALVSTGIKMDMVGVAQEEFSVVHRDTVAAIYPRTRKSKAGIIQAFCDGLKHKPDTTSDTVDVDGLADKEPHLHRCNFCSVIRGSRWIG